MPDRRTVINGQGAGDARTIPPGDDFLIRDVRDLQRQVRENLAAMRHMVEPLAQAIADLTAQQAALEALVDAQLSTASATTATDSAVLLPTSWTAEITAAITTPSGFTRCVVLAVGSMRLLVNPPSTGGRLAHARVTISGNSGQELYPYLDANSVGDYYVSPNHARIVTGLTTGQNVTATLDAYMSGSGDSVYHQEGSLSVLGVFLR